jgi:death-on-curing protein
VSSPSRRSRLRADIVTAIHDAQLAEHGGLPGVRSPDLLESIDAIDAVTAGAMYAIAFAHDHPGVAWTAMRTFLKLNGVALEFTRADAVVEMWALAAGERTDEQFTDWVRRHATR